MTSRIRTGIGNPLLIGAPAMHSSLLGSDEFIVEINAVGPSKISETCFLELGGWRLQKRGGIIGRENVGHGKVTPG